LHGPAGHAPSVRHAPAVANGVRPPSAVRRDPQYRPRGAPRAPAPLVLADEERVADLAGVPERALTVGLASLLSARELRAPYHFRAWRRRGLDVGFAFDWRGDWGRMLANELRGMRTVRAERRRANAAMALPRFE
jgi:hypothetical protein